MSAFDYERLDDESMQIVSDMRNLCQDLAELIEASTKMGRERALALTKLEEAFMWMGKAVRNDYLARQPKPEDLGL